MRTPKRRPPIGLTPTKRPLRRNDEEFVTIVFPTHPALRRLRGLETCRLVQRESPGIRIERLASHGGRSAVYSGSASKSSMATFPPMVRIPRVTQPSALLDASGRFRAYLLLLKRKPRQPTQLTCWICASLIPLGLSRRRFQHADARPSLVVRNSWRRATAFRHPVLLSGKVSWLGAFGGPFAGQYRHGNMPSPRTRSGRSPRIIAISHPGWLRIKTISPIGW